ncbi:HDOD domain-containing protein (plasmid) [Pseudoalteromonas xiamenensis]|uniref:HDOD domain-containing protein n=1 Tax=Pseudoalteromonas xiamenensis TaxID=882626 RepID=UPI0027E47857|nr:HDOD domain-containing protein [Pseudoalteromonas xiamenensis]WMN62289.1 HDOD domain-containing protein [Pseudoalteromonas xiamenensis]
MILIDDDALLLKALSRAILHIDFECEVKTVNNPLEFAACVEELGEPDIIFSDLVMPECSGLEVLEQARIICPTALRCLLSGEVATDFSMQVDNLAHFYLAKPFTKAQLVDVINASKLLPLLGLTLEERAELGQLTKLPVLPETLIDTLRLLRLSPPLLEQAADLISLNPPLAAKLIQISNSAMLGFASPVHSVQQAVFRLGSEFTEAILTCFEIEKIGNQRISSKQLFEINNKAMKKAQLAKSLGPVLDLEKQDIEDLQVVCLLGAIGEICVLQLSEHSFNWQMKEATTLSAYLLTLWGFPGDIVLGELICQPATLSAKKLTLAHAVLEDAIASQDPKWKATVQKILFEKELYDKALDWRKGVSK